MSAIDLATAHYIIYVDNKPVHECDDWAEAHSTYLGQYGIEENTGLPIYVSIDGVPMWGNTPAEQAKSEVQTLLARSRKRYLNKLAKEQRGQGTSSSDHIECAPLNGVQPFKVLK